MGENPLRSELRVEDRLQSGEGAGIPHLRTPKGSLRERRSEEFQGVLLRNPRMKIYSNGYENHDHQTEETPVRKHLTFEKQYIMNAT
jgi:hypothetical protein